MLAASSSGGPPAAPPERRHSGSAEKRALRAAKAAQAAQAAAEAFAAFSGRHALGNALVEWVSDNCDGASHIATARQVASAFYAVNTTVCARHQGATTVPMALQVLLRGYAAAAGYPAAAGYGTSDASDSGAASDASDAALPSPVRRRSISPVRRRSVSPGRRRSASPVRRSTRLAAAASGSGINPNGWLVLQGRHAAGPSATPPRQRPKSGGPPAS